MRGQNLALASHNHKAIEALLNTQSDLIKAYHFKTHFGADGKLTFDYRLVEGQASSNAIEVAKAMGFPEEIIKIAESLK